MVEDTAKLVDDLFDDPTTEPKSGIFKFEKVGDAIQGVLTDEPFDQEGKFGPQKGYLIETKEGDQVTVFLKAKSNKRQIQQLRVAEVGDVIAFKFTGTYETDFGNPGKSIEVRVKKHS
jgi:hypothetical protein